MEFLPENKQVKNETFNLKAENGTKIKIYMFTVYINGNVKIPVPYWFTMSIFFVFTTKRESDFMIKILRLRYFSQVK